jgi:hypothetical protein
MTSQNSTRASFQMSSGLMQLVRDDGEVLLSRTVPEPQRLSPTRRNMVPLFRIRSEFMRFILQHGIEIVEGGAA